MTASARRASATTVILLAAGAAALLANGKPSKPVTTVSATMTFRCYSVPDSDTDPCTVAGEDAKSADHVGNEAGVEPRTYQGGFVGSTSAYLKVTGTGRAFQLFLHPPLLSTQDGVPSRDNECDISTVAGCNPGPLLPFDGTSALFGDAEVNIKVLDSTTLADGSLTAMPCVADVADTGSLALVHFTFRVPGGEGHWGLNFNKRAYHSTGATIRRVANTRWVVEATTTQYAELISFNHSAIQGKKGPSHEGRFVVPFQLTIETNGLPSGSATCS